MAVKSKPVESIYLPYTLFKNTYATISCISNEDNFVRPQTRFNYVFSSKTKTEIPPERIPFEELLTFSESGKHDSVLTFKMGFGYLNYTTDKVRQMPIDMIINHDAVINLANFYNAQGQTFGYSNANIATIKNILENENIYYIIKYLRFLDNFKLNRTRDQYTTNTSMYYQLYNDTVGGEYFCKYIYRAKMKHTDIGFNKYNDDKRLYYSDGMGGVTNFAKIPVFRVNTNDADLNFFIVIRNFKIPMKRVKTSGKLLPNQTTPIDYTFIYLCPEYILKQYSEHVDAIKYIISNRRTDKEYSFWYDYLTTQNGNHLWAHDIENGTYKNYGIKLGNTNSNISFME